MKTTLFSILTCLLILSGNYSFSQTNEELTAIAPVTEEGNGLDLTAVLEVFKNSNDLDDFEKRLNDQEIGVNNLDLNNDSLIDYIRVVEQQDNNYRIIILQAVLAENQYQDVATINVEKESDDNLKMQIQGDEEIYGQDYYVEPPAQVHVHVWPIWAVLFAPRYVVYHSPYYWRYYPHYYKPYYRVYYYDYYSRDIIVLGRENYYYSRNRHVHRPPSYIRNHSAYVVTRPNSGRNYYKRNSSGSNSRNNNGRVRTNPNHRNNNYRNVNNGSSNHRNSNDRRNINSNNRNTNGSKHDTRINNRSSKPKANSRNTRTINKNTSNRRSTSSSKKSVKSHNGSSKNSRAKSSRGSSNRSKGNSKRGSRNSKRR